MSLSLNSIYWRKKTSKVHWRCKTKFLVYLNFYTISVFEIVAASRPLASVRFYLSSTKYYYSTYAAVSGTYPLSPAIWLSISSFHLLCQVYCLSVFHVSLLNLFSYSGSCMYRLPEWSRMKSYFSCFSVHSISHVCLAYVCTATCRFISYQWFTDNDLLSWRAFSKLAFLESLLHWGFSTSCTFCIIPDCISIKSSASLKDLISDTLSFTFKSVLCPCFAELHLKLILSLNW